MTDLKDNIKTMSQNEKRIEQPDRVVDIVEEIPDFNKQNQERQGLKILTPEQMLNRLPITLAQLKAGNNSEKPKKIYNNLINSLLKMETIFMTTENSKTNVPHKFRLTLADRLNLKDPNKNMALANLSIYYRWKNIKSAYNSNKFKISAPTWNDVFDLPDGSYSVSDVQDYFEYIVKNMRL